MKFFYINNSLCVQCDQCISVCPTGAIYVNGDKRSINHDKCIACGNCIKSCNDDAIGFETVGQMVEKMEKAEEYLVRLGRAERELSAVRERLISVEDSFDVMLRNLPMAAFIAKKDGNIIAANQAFIDLAKIDDLRLSGLSPNLAGENFKHLVKTDSVLQHKLFTFDTNEAVHIGIVNGVKVSVRINPISADTIFCMIYDLREKAIAADQVLSLLKDSIDRKMAMVQKIGSLLGEETTAEINDINAAINIIESAQMADEQ